MRPGIFLNNQLPGRVIVTFDRVLHYSCQPGNNTMQIQLFQDGKIVMAFKGISSLTSGSITGLSPGPNLPSLAVDFRTQTNVNVPAGTAVYEYFTSANPFNIDNSFIVFTPQAGGGYNVRTILPPNPAQNNVVAGGGGAGAGDQVGQAAARRNTVAAAGTTLRAADLANAEVTVRSSGNVDWVRMMNTDANGNFLMTGIPAGGINVTVTRRGTGDRHGRRRNRGR